MPAARNLGLRGAHWRDRVQSHGQVKETAWPCHVGEGEGSWVTLSLSVGEGVGSWVTLSCWGGGGELDHLVLLERGGELGHLVTLPGGGEGRSVQLATVCT